MSPRMNKRSVIKVTSIYIVFSAIWIFSSDFVLAQLIEDIDSYQFISTIKGLVFIVISSFIIYFFVNREMISLNKAYADIGQLKTFDPLTNLYNRDSFYREVEYITKKGKKVSFVMTDVNGLKVFNEIYTADKGNAILKEYASLLKQHFPEKSFIARLGGDEFCVIMYNCDRETVRKYTNELKTKVTKQTFASVNITISIGFGSTYDTMNDIQEALTLSEDTMIQDKLLIQSSASNSIISSLKSTLFERSDETELHAVRLADICSKMGFVLNLPLVTINELKLLAILHDIGKIGIDDNVLKKKGKLTEEEYERMKQHPEIGYKIASGVPALESIAYCILTHHEKWDGTGYPKGLKGVAIPLQSRILAIADTYDAMINDRVYRKGQAHQDAIDEIVKYRGTQFDPNLVDIFVSIMKEKPSIK